MNKLWISACVIVFSAIYANPVVMVDLPGLLGNRLFAFCAAKIVAEELGGWDVYSKPIFGFPETYSCQYNQPLKKYKTEVVYESPHHFFDLQEVFKNKSVRNIKLNGYFISYAYLKNYTDLIRNKWLKISSELLLTKNKNSIVVHVRADYPDCYFIPFEFYQTALSTAQYDQVYICTDNPSHPFLRNFDRYNPIIVSTRNITHTLTVENRSWDEISALNMDDFLFMMSFDKIIYGVSSYAWWAAFLSEAKEIYAPYDDKFKYLKVDEDRYHYILTEIGR